MKSTARKSDIVTRHSRVTATGPAGVRRPREPVALHVVLPLGAESTSRGTFIAIISGVLLLGLFGLLWINTSLAQGAFQISALQAERSILLGRQAQVTRVLETVAAPAALEGKARSLGMVPSRNPAFLRLSDGEILGNPKPARGVPIRRLPLSSADALAPEPPPGNGGRGGLASAAH